MAVAAELEHAVGPKGCVGCSTMCYNWDEEFREKIMRPVGRYRVRSNILVGKEYLKENHPRVTAVARSVKHLLGV